MAEPNDNTSDMRAPHSPPRQEFDRQELLDSITAASKRARNIHLFLVLFLSYWVITIIGTSDRQLILDQTTVLPIFNATVSVDVFFIASPAVAIFLFIYLQAYLCELEVLFRQSEEQSLTVGYVFPWSLNAPRFASDAAPWYSSRSLMSFLLEYCLLPLVLLLNALWYLQKHEATLSYVVGATPFIGALVVIYFGIRLGGRSLKTAISPAPSRLYAYGGALIVLLVPFNWMIHEALQGRFSALNIDLSYQVLVPEGNTGYPDDYWANHWVDLSGINLRGANLSNVVLPRADFRDSDLRGALLRDGDFVRADFSQADLRGIRARDADFRGAYFVRADLRDADLTAANFTRADFWLADLTDAGLYDTYLEYSDLREANLTGTDLRSTNLTGTHLWRSNFTDVNLLNSLNYDEPFVVRTTFSELLQLKTLYKAQLEESLKAKLMEQKPELFDPPSD